MIDYCVNLWSDFQEWKDEVSEPITEWFDANWSYYTQERAILKGLPFAAVSSLVCAYLFNCAKPSTGAIFGIVNYITTTSSLELIRTRYKITNLTGMLLLGINCAVSLAFIRTICKTPMGYQPAILLSIASLAGQIARKSLSNKDYAHIDDI